jgi:hypothetical protein
VIRAEPVSALYEERQDKVRHAGKFVELEDQLLNFSSAGYQGERSPDRADAHIHAVTELLLANTAQGWIEYYASLAAKGAAPDAQIENKRPWRPPEAAGAPAAAAGAPPAQGTGADLVATYDQAYRDALGITAPVCKACGKPVGNTRVSDGVDVWHPECKL